MAAGRKNQYARGILMMMGALAVFSLLNASAKSLLLELNPQTVVFMRYLMGLIVTLAWLIVAGEVRAFRSAHPKTQFLRGVLLLGSTAFNFMALQHLQLAQTAAITFTSPLWVCALSHVLLGERVGPRRWAAVIAGFGGVLIIMRPGLHSFHWAMGLSLTAAMASAFYQLTTRQVGADDRSETSLLYGTLWGTLGAFPAAVLAFQMPVGWQWAVFAFIGFCASFGHYLLIAAYRIVPAPLLAPYSYTQIIWMTLLGLVLFGQVPDGWTVVGGMVVVASGLYVLRREKSARTAA